MNDPVKIVVAAIGREGLEASTIVLCLHGCLSSL